MISIVKLTSLAMAAACPKLSAASRPTGSEGTGLSGSVPSFGSLRLRGIGVSGSDVVAPRGLAVREVSERPTKAPAAVAQAHAYALAADGVGIRTNWADGADYASVGDTLATATTKQHLRAFRGLEPWRDPA